MLDRNLFYLRMFRFSEPKTIREISKLSGVPYDKLCKYERGEHVPRVRTLRKLANLYQQSIEDLEDGTFYKEIEKFLFNKRI